VDETLPDNPAPENPQSPLQQETVMEVTKTLIQIGITFNFMRAELQRLMAGQIPHQFAYQEHVVAYTKGTDSEVAVIPFGKDVKIELSRLNIDLNDVDLIRLPKISRPWLGDPVEVG
jgi:hypothetical protein